MNTKQDITSILSSKRIAIIGLSQDPKSYSRLLEKELHKRGIEIFGVNPNATAIDGLPCFPNVAAVTPPVDVALVVLPPEKSDELVRECLDANITKIWVRGKEGKRSVSDSLANGCASRGVLLVDGFCPLMFLAGTGFPHNFHGLIARWFKLAPK